MLAYRAGQFQNAALAGEDGFAFRDYQDNKQWSAEAWSAYQTLDAWENKPLQELKQINMNWKTTSYQDNGQTIYVNPNGNPKDNSGYYTQSRKFYNDWKD